MRNRALDLVETDWAIVLDGHEWIEHAQLIPGALETTAWSIEIETLYEPDEQRIPGLSFPFPRIHRRHVRFGGAAAHEEVTTPADRRSSRREIKVWHERRPGAAATARSAEKAGAELQVLRDAWLHNADARALFYLANGLREARRDPEAIDAYTSYLRVSRFPEEAWQARLYLARCRAALNEWAAAQETFADAVMMAPGRAEAAIGLGHALLAQGDARRAAAWFRMATGLPEPSDSRLFVEVPLYRWGAWHGLALALDRLGDYGGALDAERRAAERGAGQVGASQRRVLAGPGRPALGDRGERSAMTKSLHEAILDDALSYTSFFNGRLLSGEDLARDQRANREARRENRTGHRPGDRVWPRSVRGPQPEHAHEPYRQRDVRCRGQPERTRDDVEEWRGHSPRAWRGRVGCRCRRHVQRVR